MTDKFRPKKRLGQNFLIDATVPIAIADAAELSASDQVLEIGPGQGVLTRELVKQAGKVVAVELDTRLEKDLKALQEEASNLRIVWGDFLQTSFTELGMEEAQAKVVANIPYYITTPILLKLLHGEDFERLPFDQVPPRPQRILLMVQEEVAARLMAKPGCKDYGSLTILAQYAAEITSVIKVPRTSFRPKPEVDSRVLMLIPREKPPVDVADPKRYFQLVRGAFGQRRKTVLNALQAAGFERAMLEKALADVGIDPMRRGETLSLQDFANLANQTLS